MKKIELILLSIILAGAFMVRLYQFAQPIADWHSWRQADTSAVSRNFIKLGFDILHPKFDDLSKGVSLLDNPQGYRFVEFPFYNVLQAGGFKLFGHFTIEEWGRLVSIVASLISIIFIYAIAKKYISKKGGFFAAFFYAFIPYDIYYARTLLPDGLMVMFFLGGLYFFDLWLEPDKPSVNLNFIISFLFLAAAVLMKPFILFFGITFLYMVWKKFGIGFIKKWQLWIYVILSILPFVLWRLWMQQYPEGIPQSNWLFNGNGVRFKGAFFQWLFADRISKLILGYFGLPFVIAGIVSKIKKEGFLFVSMILSSFVYMSVIATGNVQHDYYQMLIIPVIAFLFAKGLDFIIDKAGEEFGLVSTYLTVVISLVFMFSFAWYVVRDYYNLQHHETVQVGMIADKILPRNAKVIAPYGGDTTFLYSVNRMGWPVVDRSFPEFIKDGAQYMVFVNPGKPEMNFVNYFATVAQGTVDKGVKYIIFDLTKPLPRSYEIMHP